MTVMKKNWRDVGQTLYDEYGASPIGPCRLFRCGRIDYCTHEELGCPMTILNLRNDPDPSASDLGWSGSAANVSFLQLATENKVERYDTANPEVRNWLASIASLLITERTQWPVLLHCRSGKDRTGIAVAMLLKVLGVTDAEIMGEFLLCTDVKVSTITRNPSL